MIVVALDPGTEKTAWVKFDCAKFKILDFALTPNADLVNSRLLRNPSAHLIVEVFKSYGNVIGDSVLETCIWIGRFIQAANGSATRYFRRTVVTNLCRNPRGGDKQVRQALIDRFAATGGGKVPSIGTRSKPGPFYGVTGDVWSALAVAVTHADFLNEIL